LGTLDWIVQKVFELPPLLEGHEAAVERVANPGLTWLRAVAVEVVRLGRCREELSATQLVEISDNAPHKITIPGAKSRRDENGSVLQVGNVMGGFFKEGDRVRLDAYEVRRITTTKYNAERRENVSAKYYVFRDIEKEGDEEEGGM
jgi:hypothetical protein